MIVVIYNSSEASTVSKNTSKKTHVTSKSSITNQNIPVPTLTKQSRASIRFKSNLLSTHSKLLRRRYRRQLASTHHQSLPPLRRDHRRSHCTKRRHLPTKTHQVTRPNPLYTARHNIECSLPPYLHLFSAAGLSSPQLGPPSSNTLAATRQKRQQIDHDKRLFPAPSAREVEIGRAHV